MRGQRRKVIKATWIVKRTSKFLKPNLFCLIFYWFSITKFLIDFSFMMFMRLFIVMGIAWIMEAISFVVSPTPDSNDYKFIFFNMCNTLQGIPLFTLFVLKPRIWKLIKKRFVCLVSHLFFQILFLASKFRFNELSGGISTTQTSLKSSSDNSNGNVNALQVI